MELLQYAALIIGAFIGVGIAKAMFWLVMKAKSQSHNTTITRSANGSINIQAAGDLNINNDGDKATIKVTDQYGCEYEHTPEDEAVSLKQNLLD